MTITYKINKKNKKIGPCSQNLKKKRNTIHSNFIHFGTIMKYHYTPDTLYYNII